MNNVIDNSTTRLDRLLHTLALHQAPRDRATVYAITKAMALLDDGRLGAALSMLEYANRLSPSDGAINLTIGIVRLALGEPSAADPLEMLTKRSDWCDVWMALILVRMRFGNGERAAVELQEMLSRIAVPYGAPDVELATMVTQFAGAPGWCGLDNTGRVHVHSNRKSLNGLALLLDGTEISYVESQPMRGVCELRLPRGWRRATRLDALLQGRSLIGSPVDITRITRVEGFVEADNASGAVHGWCRFPAERERAPAVTIASLANPRKRRLIYAESNESRSMGGDEFAVLHKFTIRPEQIEPLGNAISVAGPHGQALYGSPICALAAMESTRAAVSAVARLFPPSDESRKRCLAFLPREIPAPVALVVPPRVQTKTETSGTCPQPVDIVVPVYRGRAATLACIASVHAQLGTNERIVVVSDGSPERELVAALSVLAGRGEITLHLEKINRGFPGAANVALRLAAGHDVVLLNSDTIVTPGWLVGLRAAVHSVPDIGTATPLSNDATIFSYPRRDAANSCPNAAAAVELATLASEVNQGEVVEVPTGHGFCLYIRAECLDEVGLLREDLFAQGYGEENDFCMRARHLGWRHVAATGVFVAHRGAGSFSAARKDLMRRNLDVLNRLHVGYNEMIARWLLQDPLAKSRRRIDLARLRKLAPRLDAVLLVTHNRDGGVRRHVAERLKAISRTGRRAILLQPEPRAAAGAGTSVARVDTGFDDEFPNLRFHLPDERADLLSCLQACGVREIEVHSLIGHSDGVIDLILSLEAPVDMVIHDYSWFCPRISLTGGDHQYCGEPTIAACRHCVADNGTSFDEPVLPDELVHRTQRLREVTRSIIAPSGDSARRIEKRFGCKVVIGEWEQPRQFVLQDVREAAGQSRPVRICVVGAIGYEKGYTNLLECARIVAAADMPIEFVVVGYTCDDKRLLDTDIVRITGRYTETEAVELIRAQDADFAWLPSVGPETWCYGLTQIWEAGLYVVVHDIGAQAERVRATGGGLVVPLNLPADRLLALFMQPELILSQRLRTITSRAGSPNANVTAL